MLGGDGRESGAGTEGAGEAATGQARIVEAPPAAVATPAAEAQRQEQTPAQPQRVETTNGVLVTQVPIPQRPGSTPDSCAIPFNTGKPHDAEWYYQKEHKTAPTCAYPLLAEEVIIGVSICKV